MWGGGERLPVWLDVTAGYCVICVGLLMVEDVFSPLDRDSGCYYLTFYDEVMHTPF